MRLGECAPCQMGEHDRHIKDYDPVPRGVLGGSMCPCAGECVERGPRPLPALATVLELEAAGVLQPLDDASREGEGR